MSNDAQSAFERGKGLFKSKDYPAAEDAFAEAVRLAPQNADYHAWLGRSYIAQEKRDTALREVERALKLDSRCAVAYFVRGILFRDNEQWDRAIQDYTRAIELDPQDANAYYNRGNMFIKREEWDQAIQDHTRALELDPQKVDAYQSRAYAFAHNEQWDRAIQDCTREIELDPQYVEAYVMRGTAFAHNEQWDRAIQDYTRVLELDPQRVDVYVARSKAYEVQGNVAAYLGDRARACALRGPLRWTSSDSDWNWVCGVVFGHLTETLMPQFKSSGEQLVIYIPCRLTFGHPKDSLILGGDTLDSEYYHRRGVGYVCVTDRQLWIVSLGEPSRRLIKGQSLGSMVLRFFAGVELERVPEDDLTWAIPYGSNLGVQTEDDIIVLTTSSDSWRVGPLSKRSLTPILKGIEMGKAGKLAHLWDPPRQPDSAPAVPDRAEVLKLLAQLGELKSSGVLSEAEFEEQKKKLLAQL